MSIIKVGFCVSYDWEFLKKSVPRVYKNADSICFSLDKNRISWSGKKFDFDEKSFYSWVKEIDQDKKINLYEDNFYLPHLSSIENDSLQRQLMSKQMGEGGWHVQVDSDEYFFDFDNFCNYLKSLIANPSGNEKPVNVHVNAISLIKKVSKGYLFVNNNINGYEEMPLATNKPEYLAARKNSHFNSLSPFFLLHETWARGEEDLQRKLNSWGHDNDFLSKESYFNLWKALDEYNHIYLQNFHPLNGPIWQKLGYVPELEVERVIEWMQTHINPRIEKTYLTKRNSRILQGIKQRLG